jgi:hypothetical protein
MAERINSWTRHNRLEETLPPYVNVPAPEDGAPDDWPTHNAERDDIPQLAEDAYEPQVRDDHDTVAEHNEAAGYEDVISDGQLQWGGPDEEGRIDSESQHQPPRLNNRGPSIISGHRHVGPTQFTWNTDSLIPREARAEYPTATEAMINEREGQRVAALRRARERIERNILYGDDLHVPQPTPVLHGMQVSITHDRTDASGNLTEGRALAVCQGRGCNWRLEGEVDEMGEVWGRATGHYYQHHGDNSEPSE